LLQWLKEGGMDENALADIEAETGRRLNILADDWQRRHIAT
jgi:hypothetical protein